MKGRKIKATLLIAIFILSTITMAIPFVSATNDYIELGTSDDGIAEWTMDKAYSGSYSVHLEIIDGAGDTGKAEISIPIGSRPLFSEITELGFMEYIPSELPSTSLDTASFIIKLVAAQDTVWTSEEDGTMQSALHFDSDYIPAVTGGYATKVIDTTTGEWLTRDIDERLAWWQGADYYTSVTRPFSHWKDGTGGIEDLGDWYVAGVMVLVCSGPYTGYDGYIDDITMNSVTYPLEPFATVTPDLVATDETTWFDVEVQNILSEASLYIVEVVYPYTTWTFVDVLPSTGWMIDSHILVTGTLTFKAVGSGIAPGESSTFQFKMTTPDLTDTTTIYDWDISSTDTGENTFDVIFPVTVDGTDPTATLDAPSGVTYYSVSEGYLWLNLTVTDDLEFLPNVIINDTRFELLDVEHTADTLDYTFCYVNNVAIADGPLAVSFNVTDHVGNWYETSLAVPNEDVSVVGDTTVDNTAPIITIKIYDSPTGEELPKVGGMYYMGAELETIYVNYTGIDNAFDPDYSYVYINDTEKFSGAAVQTNNATAEAWPYTVTDFNYLVINVTITDTSLPQNHTIVLKQTVVRDLVGPHTVGFTEVETICGGLIVRGLYSDDLVGTNDYVFYMNGTEHERITNLELSSTEWTYAEGSFAAGGFNGIAVLNLAEHAGDLVNITVVARDYGLNPSDVTIVYEGLVPEGMWIPVPLYEGYNLMSLPLIPDSPAREDILSLILDQGASAVTITYEYDQYNDAWIMNPDEMTDGWGYWLYLNEYDVMIVEGEETLDAPVPPATYAYTEGWVLGGYKEIETGTDYFASFEADSYLAYVYVWNAPQLTWTMVPVTTTMDLYPGQGFWIWMHEDQFLIPPIL